MLHWCIVSVSFSKSALVTYKTGTEELVFSVLDVCRVEDFLDRVHLKPWDTLKLARKCFSCPLWKYSWFTSVSNRSLRQNKHLWKQRETLTGTTTSRYCTADDTNLRWEILPRGKMISALGEFSTGCTSYQCFLLLLLHLMKKPHTVALWAFTIHMPLGEN